MENKIKILYINHTSSWGGAIINLINIINRLNKDEFIPCVFLFNESKICDELKKHGIKYVVANTKYFKKYYKAYDHTLTGYIRWYQPVKNIKLIVKWFLSRYIFIPKELKTIKYDIIHLNSVILTDWLKPCKKSFKVVMHVQEPISYGNFKFRYTFFRNQIRKYTDHIIAISFDNLERLNLKIKTTVVYNFAEVSKEKSPKESYSSKKVIYFGGNQKIKGFHLITEALNLLDGDIKVFFAGNYQIKNSNNLKSYFKKILLWNRKTTSLTKKLNENKQVVLLGLIQDVHSYLKEVCCVVSPFTIPHFSRPTIESFLHAKPVIVTNIQGSSEIVINNYNGIIIKKNNPVFLAKAINDLAKDPKKAKKMGENGYKIALEKFTSENVKTIEQIYHSL